MSRREQNKAGAYRAIHEAAYRLTVVEQAQPTVEEIAAAAQVSPRTFFNYFRSKEEAVLGLRPAHIEEDQYTHVGETKTSDLFEHVTEMFFEVIRSSVVDRSTFYSRSQELRELPLYRVVLAKHFGACEVLVQEAVSRHLASESAPFDGSYTVEDAARALTVLAGAAAKFVFARYPAALTHDDDHEYRSSLAAFRTIIRETL
ncbi:TetR/AcrR family transcriptional regulator [Timonella sp. A28]|uniref:TetR/AcrR family transcriptional regulator n=1 Tax=Timonella sp. A28 TaxID=3442640 RepID=UPI003EBEA4F1